MLTRDEILARKTAGLTPVEYKLTDGSGTVLIRGLTLKERQAAGVAGKEQTAEAVTASTAMIIGYGLVKPELTADDIEAWFEVRGQAQVLEDLANAIADQSGLAQGAAKSGV
jgi:hypothetical protein